MNEELISIIIPVYNVEKYIRYCLESVINQTYKNLEIIIVDDGSKDSSGQIADEYALKDSRIKVIHKENGGLSDARNFGIKKAQGDYLIFIDSDDYVDVTMIEKLYNYAIKNELDIVTCNCLVVYENNDKKVAISSNLDYSDDDVKNFLLSKPAAWNKIFKKELFNNNQFKKGIYYEDLELIPRLVNNTKKIGFINDALYYYLQREGSIMHQKEFNQKLLDIFKVLETIKESIEKDYPEEIEYIHITHLLRTATLRFLDYKDGYKYLDKINKIMKDNFPTWNKNQYYKKSSWKLKTICVLAYNKQYSLLKIIKKIFE